MSAIGDRLRSLPSQWAQMGATSWNVWYIVTGVLVAVMALVLTLIVAVNVIDATTALGFGAAAMLALLLTRVTYRIAWRLTRSSR